MSYSAPDRSTGNAFAAIFAFISRIFPFESPFALISSSLSFLMCSMYIFLIAC